MSGFQIQTPDGDQQDTRNCVTRRSFRKVAVSECSIGQSQAPQYENCPSWLASGPCGEASQPHLTKQSVLLSMSPARFNSVLCIVSVILLPYLRPQRVVDLSQTPAAY